MNKYEEFKQKYEELKESSFVVDVKSDLVGKVDDK